MLGVCVLTFAVALAVPQQAVPHPLPPRTEQPPGVLAVVGVTLYPVSGPPVEDGVMLVEGGRITAVGAAGEVDVPAGARVLDLSGMTIMPGLVESHSHMGFKQVFRPETGSNNNELSKPINAEVRAVDGLATQDAGFRIALAAGITTMNITTGSRSFASGQAVVVKLRGRSVDEMWLAPGGLKFAMRIQSRNQWRIPVPEILVMLRERLREAQAYLEARARHQREDRGARGEGGGGGETEARGEGTGPIGADDRGEGAGRGDRGASAERREGVQRAGLAEAPPWDPQLEALGKALSGEWPVGVHAHGVEAMRAAIALKDEFGLNLYIHHADATLELAEELAAKRIPISFGPVLPSMGRDDPELAGPVRLAELGGSVSFHQDHPDGPQYYLRQSAALFVRMGMSEADALRALTLEPARLFGLEDRIGGLEAGKDADFIVLDGPPLDWESRVWRVFIEGVEVYRLEEEEATGSGSARARTADAVRRSPADRPAAEASIPRGEAADLAVVGGEVRPVSGPPIDDGVVLVRGGRIVAVGPRSQVELPAGVEVLDATGLVVTPGFIDGRTSVALGRGGSSDRNVLIRSPDVRMADSLGELRVPGVFGMEARETPAHPWTMDGVTTAYVAPDTANLVAGFGSIVKLAGDRLGPLVNAASALHVSLGEGPLNRFDAPTTRQGMVAVLRQWLTRARQATPGGSFTLGGPATDVEGLDGPSWIRGPDLGAVLAGERPVRFHAHTPDDVLTALRVAEEFGLAAVIEGASGAHMVADPLAEARVPVVLGPAIGGAGGGGSPETFAHTVESAARLHRAGVPVAFSTDASGGRSVTVEAIMARGHGLPADQTLRALTLEAARILGVEARVGSLEPGKDADLVLWSGDPVGTWGEARVVVVDGQVVFRRPTP